MLTTNVYLLLTYEPVNLVHKKRRYETDKDGTVKYTLDKNVVY